jgi:hypothetical protein
MQTIEIIQTLDRVDADDHTNGTYVFAANKLSDVESLKFKPTSQP